MLDRDGVLPADSEEKTWRGQKAPGGGHLSIWRRFYVWSEGLGRGTHLRPDWDWQNIGDLGLHTLHLQSGHLLHWCFKVSCGRKVYQISRCLSDKNHLVMQWSPVSPGLRTQHSRLIWHSTYSSWSTSSSGSVTFSHPHPQSRLIDLFSSLPLLTSSGSCWSCIPLLTTSPSLPHLSPSISTGIGLGWGSSEP